MRNESLNCRNCTLSDGIDCPETGVRLPCETVLQLITPALHNFPIERGLDPSSDEMIAGRLVQLGTFRGLKDLGEQACAACLIGAFSRSVTI